MQWSSIILGRSSLIPTVSFWFSRCSAFRKSLKWLCPKRICQKTSPLRFLVPFFLSITNNQYPNPFLSFFRYCHVHFSENPQHNPLEDQMQNGRRQTVLRKTTRPNGERHEEEVDLLTEFSWRNFFSTINCAKIMQKLSKHRSHRIRMLVQYKSSVSKSDVYRWSSSILLMKLYSFLHSPSWSHLSHRSFCSTIVSIFGWSL